MKLKTTIKLRAMADCKSHALANIEVRDLVQIIDEPTERGGTNLGFTPTDTALSALIGCTNVIGHKCAKNLGIDIGNLHISAVADFDRRGVTLTEEIEIPFERIKLTIISDGPASDSDLERVAADLAKYCPLAKLFRSAGTEIIEVWKRA